MVKHLNDKFAEARIPNDHLETRVAETSELEKLMVSMESCGDQLLNALSQLQSAPSLLLDEIGKSYMPNSACGELTAQLNACIFRFTCGIPHLKGLMEHLQQVRSNIAVAKDAIASRHAAWAAKERSLQAFDEIKQRKGRAFSAEEKSARMKAKYDAEIFFDESTSEATQIINDLLSQRAPITATALTELCHCYASIFEAPPKLATELYKSAAKLASMSTKASLPSPVKSDRESRTRIACPRSKFSKGDPVEVWSSSRNKWLDGIVKEVFNTPGSYELYSVPAGAIKVESSAGVKFFKPEETSELRKKC